MKKTKEKSEVLEILIELQKDVKSIPHWRQLEAVWLREKFGLNGQDVANALNYKLQTVHTIWHNWKQKGFSWLKSKRSKGGRNHAYLSVDDEKIFLKTFLKKAESGELLTIKRIKKSYEKLVEKEVALSTIYRLLKRHGWRKITPRKQHPKSDPMTQSTVKKT